MNELRLLLLFLGACLIAGIYFWSVMQERRAQRQKTVRDYTATDHSAEMKLSSGSDSEIDYNSALAGLKNSMTSDAELSIDNLSLKDEPEKARSTSVSPDETRSAKPENSETANNHSTASIPVDEIQKIITFNIIPRAREFFHGAEIVEVMESVDMHLGDMDIYHHYGVGDMKMNRPLFSLANIREPGSFSIEQLNELKTPGLVMFMCLPTVFDAEVVFELMLNTAQRMAEQLGADVCDEKRALLSENTIDEIRASVLE